MEQIVRVVEQFFSNFSPIGITDIIDIAIVAFVIYKIIYLVRTCLLYTSDAADD